MLHTRKTISLVYGQIQTMADRRLELNWLAQYSRSGGAGRAIRIVLAVAALTMSATLLAFAMQQDPFDPFEGNAGKYHFNLRNNFFANEAAESASREVLTADAQRLDVLTGRATKSGRSLLEELELQDRIQRNLGKHQAYLSLRYYSDTRDTAALAQLNALTGDIGAHLQRFNQTIAGISAPEFLRFEKQEPRLHKYRFAFTLIRQESSHRRSPEAEGVLAALEPIATEWGPSLFWQLLNGRNLGTIRTPTGDLDVKTQYPLISTHSDRSVRQKGYELSQQSVAVQRDQFAFILVRSAQARNAIARQRQYADYLEESYNERFLTKEEVGRFLSAIEQRAEINKEYERTRIAHLRCALGYDEIHTWDLALTDPAQPPPRLTIQQTSRALLAAAAPLGSEYMKELEALINPANGRLDTAPGQNKANRPGFSTGSVGYPSTFFQGRYSGSLDDVVIFAHESSHAVQNMLMDNHGVLARYAGGPSYFTESFAFLGEFTVLEFLYRRASTPSEKIYYLEKLLDQATDLFRTTWEAELEQSIYEDVAAGKFPQAADIESRTQEIASRYSVWYGANSERHVGWINPIQFYTRPLYRLNYVYAKALALAYLQQLHSDPKRFVARYNNLLANGYDDTPQALLQRTIGLSLSPGALIPSATSVINGWLTELNGLYKQADSGCH